MTELLIAIVWGTIGALSAVPLGYMLFIYIRPSTGKTFWESWQERSQS